MARSLIPVDYQILRNGVVILNGTMNGSAQIAYTPPDASAATYTVRFFPNGAANAQSTTIGQRGIAMVGYKR